MVYSSSTGGAGGHRAGGRRARILSVEDEPHVAQVVREILETEGYEVWTVGTGGEAEALLEEARPDLILLDLVLPDVDGLVLCAQLHGKWPAPIVILSGTQRHRDRVLSLRLGADDFIAKPFDIHELVARIDAVLRRAGGAQAVPLGAGDPRPLGQFRDEALARQSGASGGRDGGARGALAAREVYKIGELVIDRGRRSVTIAGTTVHLTPTENRLLTILASEPERVFSREELAEAIWGHDSLGESRAVDVHIRRLRAKLEPFGADAPPIVTVRGFGYKIGRDRAQDSA